MKPVWEKSNENDSGSNDGIDFVFDSGGTVPVVSFEFVSVSVLYEMEFPTQRASVLPYV